VRSLEQIRYIKIYILQKNALLGQTSSPYAGYGQQQYGYGGGRSSSTDSDLASVIRLWGDYRQRYPTRTTTGGRKRYRYDDNGSLEEEDDYDYGKTNNVATNCESMGAALCTNPVV
jgi:hypothetical protein